MTPNEPEILRDRGRSLEDEFFRREDQRLLQRLNELRAAEATREALAKASGITEPAVLQKLVELGIKAETVAALSLVPLVEVAWADGVLDAKERRAVVERAGVARDSTAGGLLEAWLDRRPDPKLLTAWTHMVEAMAKQLGPDGTARLKAGLLERARAVAEASGGLFGVGSKISASEAAMLATLEAAFPSGS
jgi:hypothetical protein